LSAYDDKTHHNAEDGGKTHHNAEDGAKPTARKTLWLGT